MSKRYPENTLRRTAIDAKNSYTLYRSRFKSESKWLESFTRSEDRIRTELAEFNPEIPPSPEVEQSIVRKLGRHAWPDMHDAGAIFRWGSKRAVDDGRQHFLENQAGYHELALIQAYIDGYDINVSMPLVIGKISTRTTLNK